MTTAGEQIEPGDEDPNSKDGLTSNGSTGAGGSGGQGSSSADFPDSTKGTALPSPTDVGTNGPFKTTWSADHGFPDLTQREFLALSFHASAFGSEKEKEDIYQRLEARLKADRDRTSSLKDSDAKLRKSAHAGSQDTRRKSGLGTGLFGSQSPSSMDPNQP